MSTSTSETNWNPNQIFENDSQQCHYAILILNQRIINEYCFVSLWKRAKLRVAIDGGGNQWQTLKEKIDDLPFPQIFCGDFDSISPKVMEAFQKENGISIIHTENQDETDFTKGLRVLKNTLDLPEWINVKVKAVIAFCENSGRFDQIMSNVETLFHSSKIFGDDTKVLLVSSTSVTFLLPCGAHRITCSGLKVPYCSLIPLGSPSVVSTTGLKWNLTKDKLAFGHLVSTSNEIAEGNEDKVVTVECSEPVLWSMEIDHSHHSIEK